MQVRPARICDCDGIARVFHDAIRFLAYADYSKDQIDAWAGRPDPDRWRRRVVDTHSEFWVAEVRGKIAGFCEFEPDGHIETLYVGPAEARRGVATALLCRVYASAASLGLLRLHTEASVTARPLFERHGFHVTATRDVRYQGAVLRNFSMEKRLQRNG